MEAIFAEMKRFVGFSDEDSANLALLRPRAEAHLEGILDRFYERIESNPSTSRLILGPDHLRRLKVTLRAWADRLLSGPHDEEYFALRARIGRAHVRAGLEQIYMFAAMNVLREGLAEVVEKELSRDRLLRDRVRTSLHKILDMELGMMLETYREEYILRLHRSEQEASVRRLADIGEMAARVAHEVRNPLAGISGAIQILRDDLPADSPRHEVIEEVLAQVRRLDDHVKDLLLYARRVELHPGPVDLDKLIRSTLALLAEEPMMREVHTHVSIPQGTVHVMDGGQIQGVLVNLIRNAARAMKGRGDLFFETRRLRSRALEIRVEDTGPGIPPERVQESFRPFFTTWPQGTGLGLSICQKILESHGGSLRYERGRHGGARFVALLPPGEPQG